VELFHRLEVRMLHGLFGSKSLSVVVAEHLAQQINGLFGDKCVILSINELVPGLAGVLSNDIIVVAVKSNIVLLDIGEQLFCAEDLGNLYQLVVVVFSLEERLFLENHACEHATQTPNVKRVVINLEVNEKLGTLEVAGSNSHVVLLIGMVELS
jgi:hypothetical protein